MSSIEGLPARIDLYGSLVIYAGYLIRLRLRLRIKMNAINYFPKGVRTPACRETERMCLPLILLNLRLGTWYWTADWRKSVLLSEMEYSIPAPALIEKKLFVLKGAPSRICSLICFVSLITEAVWGSFVGSSLNDNDGNWYLIIRSILDCAMMWSPHPAIP